jgi:hypothetical protein
MVPKPCGSEVMFRSKVARFVKIRFHKLRQPNKPLQLANMVGRPDGTEFLEAINHQKALAHREHVVVEEVEVILDRLRAAVAQGNQLIRDRSGEHSAANVVAQQAGKQQAEQAGQQHHGQHLGLHTQLAEEFDHHGGRKIGS